MAHVAHERARQNRHASGRVDKAGALAYGRPIKASKVRGRAGVGQMTRGQVAFSTEDRQVFDDGEAFGASGAYERLGGKVHVRVDPASVPEGAVADLALASLGPDGLIACTADFMILKPVDLGRGNGRLFFDYGNRGNKRALQFFNDAVHSQRAADPGACRQRLPDAARLHDRLGGLAGRSPARRRAHAARPAGRQDQRRSRRRARAHRVHRRPAGRDVLSLERPHHHAQPSGGVARHPSRQAHAPALSRYRSPSLFRPSVGHSRAWRAGSGSTMPARSTRSCRPRRTSTLQTGSSPAGSTNSNTKGPRPLVLGLGHARRARRVRLS